MVHLPFKKPSNTTLRLENGELPIVPQSLTKTTPNFHLVLPAAHDTDDFCKTTLSAMLLNLPPPTVINLYHEFQNEVQWDKTALASIRNYLFNEKYVHEDDLMLIADGETSWFQLPSDVIIKQYANILVDANARLLARYGVDENGYQKYNTSIVFAADKKCMGEDMACKFAPPSILPGDVYRDDENVTVADRPARYLNSQMFMGPVKDLKLMVEAAQTKLNVKHAQTQTIQSVLATMFGEQQLRRDAEREKKKPAATKIKDLFAGKGARFSIEKRLKDANVTLSNTTQYEFSMGLDYTHTLFQPIAYATDGELVPILHDDSSNLTELHHPSSWSQYLALPSALQATNPPFWRADLDKHNPSPNEKPAFIKQLDHDHNLDDLPRRKTSWNRVPLVQNTYTGAVPAIIQNNILNLDHMAPANITWYNMWYSPFKRALLRNYFRTPQSPIGYHNSLVGGDRAWDTRGGRGGVWTEEEQAWLPWGEVDGVCGTLNQLKEVFHDGSGVWLHEQEGDGEAKRLEEEMELAKKIAKERQKEREKGMEENAQKTKEKQNAQRLKDEERKKKDKERKKQEEENAKQQEELKKVKEKEKAAKEKEKQKLKEEEEKKKQHTETETNTEVDPDANADEDAYTAIDPHHPDGILGLTLTTEQEKERAKQEETARKQIAEYDLETSKPAISMSPEDIRKEKERKKQEDAARKHTEALAKEREKDGYIAREDGEDVLPDGKDLWK